MATPSTSAPPPAAASRHVGEAGSGAGDKGLKADAIGFTSNVVIGVASTAPGYSLAASLGLVIGVAGVGAAAPAVMIVAFLPMLFIAAAYYYMNRADPDCGTTFTWVTRALGPYLGWMGGWGIVCAGTIVMANLAQIAGLYLFLLVGWQGAADSTAAVTGVGCLFIVAMTWICVVGIELSARTQVALLSAEIVTLLAFAIVALVKVYAGDAGAGAVEPSASWFDPFAIDGIGPLTDAVLIAVFIYWGWDSTVTVNEESRDSNRTPGLAALASTVILLVVYVVISVAAQAFNGPGSLADLDDALSVLAKDVFGSPLDKIVIIAVLTSSAASCQTTILPNARTTLSMARQGAMPKRLGDVHPRFLTPHTSTILFGVLAVAYYVILTILSEDILFDSIAALGLMIAFYYALTGYACVVYYRRELTKSVRNLLFIGVAPLIGALLLTFLFVKSCIDLGAPDSGDSGAVLGLGAPLVIGLGFLLVGVVLMLVWRFSGHAAFFARRPEVVDPAVAAAAPGSAGVSAPASGGCLVVGFDGTQGARAALAEAVAVAAALGASVHLVFSYAASRSGGELRDLDEAIAERGRAVLAEGEALAGGAVAVTSETRAQDPAEGLLAVAAERDARWIVVGSYGEGPLRSALVGSTPTRLLHLSPRPVLVVKVA